ncbi:MAG: hypothetical protein JST16_14160 [Bdellovibrionales bacterium]|nr:hypothetical protein [Bdellovibrionales bacterium]
MNKLMISALVGSLFALAACGSKGSDGNPSYGTFSDSSMTGKIGGKDWAFKSGKASPFTHGQLWIELWETNVADPCAFGAMGSDRKVFTSIDPKVGLVNLDNNNNITLFDNSTGENDNHVVMKGGYEITEITDDHVTGRIVGDDGADYSVNGTFTVPRCK